MTLMISGLFLWWAAHGLHRLLPGARIAITKKIGFGASKGVMAVILLIAIILMVKGFRAAPFEAVYTPPSWGIHVNNALMLVAIGLMGLAKSKSRARNLWRHPMLMGVGVWSVAHLLVNGDLASLVLFGGLGLWSVFMMLMINARVPEWKRLNPGSAIGDVRFVIISLIVFAVISGIHIWIGPSPFGS